VAEIGVALDEVRIGLAAEVRHEHVHVEPQQQHAEDRHRDADRPSAACQGQPHAEADAGDRHVLAAGERGHHRHRRPRRAPGVHRPRGGDDQRDRKGRWMDVADIDAVKRRVQQIEDGKSRGGARIAEPARGEAGHGDGAGRKDRRLGQQERDRPRRQPPQRDEQIKDGREMIAPGMHRRQRDPRAMAVGQIPHDLDVVAEVEGVSAQRDVARDHDHAHEEDVDGDAAGDERARRHAGQRDGRQRQPRADDQRQDDHEVFRALQGHPAQPQTPGREHGDRQRREDEPRAVQRAREPPQLRRV